MARKKRDFEAESVAFNKLATLERLKEQHAQGVYSMSYELDVMFQIVEDVRNDKNPFAPLPPGTKADDYIEDLREPLSALFDLYHQKETKHEIACKYNKVNGSGLNRWLAYYLSRFFRVKRNAPEGDFFSIAFPDKKIPLTNRTDAQMVEIMLSLLEIGFMRGLSDGSLMLYEKGDEFPPRGRSKRHKR